MERPIIFVHYGNSEYLKYVFKCARLYNPTKRIILLGDQSNLKIALSNGIEHYLYEDFGKTHEAETFEKVYKHIAGEQHKKEFWTKFVFKRWFYVYGFIKENNFCDGFWHFDSDNMILTSLKDHEYKFENYDCTEQCNGICMNGLIAKSDVVEEYLKKINDLFQDNEYIEKQIKDFETKPKLAFTEMRAYKTFKEDSNIKTIRLNTIIDDESFDECICHTHGMETYNKKIGSRTLKKLYVSEDYKIFCYHLDKKRFIKMNSLNLSWVPNYLYHYILNVGKKNLNYTKNSYSKHNYNVMDIWDEPLSYKFNSLLSKAQNKITNFIG